MSRTLLTSETIKFQFNFNQMPDQDNESSEESSLNESYQILELEESDLDDK
ncbi:39857_t:CDS:2 [Gigaspora margarita]|uniref:39857_t:CDS:1 n=1 Tax=Gigaspora margarita TaxID=4874 RepID=A0ABN7UXU4_GIGMA|nr:39857_t:CDS:2 [Gigaspora margarita]